ncbi:uncharacterized protein GIQ15_05137 [Arthroderma uncinatum]|uniref:uncharacterized protein n=1 Tax=Arthroderma uncinatum TaxID=74035 RepID=UPI00144ACEE8|nr:uncharacterized protein GIQ15_05137 [Arthroderma uncinatum]KAF3482378.1 hypothetical protein GIQ15_05137 [Arthroderma uncinatum]
MLVDNGQRDTAALQAAAQEKELRLPSWASFDPIDQSLSSSPGSSPHSPVPSPTASVSPCPSSRDGSQYQYQYQYQSHVHVQSLDTAALQNLNIRERERTPKTRRYHQTTATTTTTTPKKRPASQRDDDQLGAGLPSKRCSHSQKIERGGVVFQARPKADSPTADVHVHNDNNDDDAPHSMPCTLDLVLQPETRQITEDQLIVEVQGIYSGLVMVEKKCVEIDMQQLNSRSELSNDQWEALIAIHRTLLHEHHDFFLASQHPSATKRLRKLAAEYGMPARMWRHGVHSFLELLRHRLPGSLEHMVSFIYISYSMMTLLLESVPVFVHIWIECLGDLARYRMAVEETDPQERENWAEVARYWYRMAADKGPTIGRIQHHSAVLARPHILSQLFYYTKSLQSLDFFSALPQHIGRVGEKFREQGVHISCTNVATLFINDIPAPGILTASYATALIQPVESRIASARTYWSRCTRSPTPSSMLDTIPRSFDTKFNNTLSPFHHTACLSMHTLSLLLRQIGDKNVLPAVHVSLAFLYTLSLTPEAMHVFEPLIPFRDLVIFLNTLNRQRVSESKLASDDFPLPECRDLGVTYHLPEDFDLRGLDWTRLYFPDGHFVDKELAEDEERLLEVPSTTLMDRWFTYDPALRRFEVKDLVLQLERCSERVTFFRNAAEVLAGMEPSAHTPDSTSSLEVRDPPKVPDR